MSSTDIIFDFTNLTDGVVGEHGISDDEINKLEIRSGDIYKDIEKRRADGSLPFMNLPQQNINEIEKTAKSIRTRFRNFVNVGIGGSALGAQALVQALCHPYHNLLEERENNGTRMFFADNIDPDYLKGMADVTPPEDTVYNIITKSGSTAETMSTFLLVYTYLKQTVHDNWRDHLVITTDTENGDLRKIANDNKLQSFVIPNGVGGRFSVMTPVGLLPAACSGIDIDDFLEGAAAMDHRIGKVSPMNNPAYLYAMYQYLLDTEKGKPISVMMPYSSALSGIADWWRQLWAESLGKANDLNGKTINAGPTPVKALGVTDQHSQVQLYMEGPYDKVFTLIGVEEFDNMLDLVSPWENLSSLEYFNGTTTNKLMEAERLGTTYALTSNNRPNMSITFPKVTAHAVGQLMYALEVATVFSGGLYNIDPLDQPGVEAGKVAAYALMGRKGYKDKASEIKKGVSSKKKYVK